MTVLKKRRERLSDAENTVPQPTALLDDWSCRFEKNVLSFFLNPDPLPLLLKKNKKNRRSTSTRSKRTSPRTSRKSLTGGTPRCGTASSAGTLVRRRRREEENGGRRTVASKKNTHTLSHCLSLFLLLQHPHHRLLRHARDQALHLLLPGTLRGAAVQVRVKREEEKGKEEEEEGFEALARGGRLLFVVCVLLLGKPRSPFHRPILTLFFRPFFAFGKVCERERERARARENEGKIEHTASTFLSSPALLFSLLPPPPHPRKKKRCSSICSHTVPFSQKKSLKCWFCFSMTSLGKK